MAAVAGHPLSAGAYVHLPARLEHGMDHVGEEGFTFLYLYLHP